MDAGLIESYKKCDEPLQFSMKQQKMKKQIIFLQSIFAGLISMILMTGIAIAETAEMTKPNGVMGTGSVKDGQPISNQF